MDHTEFASRLARLRFEYADALKSAAATTDGVHLIDRAESEVAEYRRRVADLIREYNGEADPAEPSYNDRLLSDLRNKLTAST